MRYVSFGVGALLCGVGGFYLPANPLHAFTLFLFGAAFIAQGVGK